MVDPAMNLAVKFECDDDGEDESAREPSLSVQQEERAEAGEEEGDLELPTLTFRSKYRGRGSASSRHRRGRPARGRGCVARPGPRRGRLADTYSPAALENSESVGPSPARPTRRRGRLVACVSDSHSLENSESVSPSPARPNRRQDRFVACVSDSHSLENSVSVGPSPARPTRRRGWLAASVRNTHSPAALENGESIGPSPVRPTWRRGKACARVNDTQSVTTPALVSESQDVNNEKSGLSQARLVRRRGRARARVNDAQSVAEPAPLPRDTDELPDPSVARSERRRCRATAALNETQGFCMPAPLPQDPDVNSECLGPLLTRPGRRRGRVSARVNSNHRITASALLPECQGVPSKSPRRSPSTKRRRKAATQSGIPQKRQNIRMALSMADKTDEVHGTVASSLTGREVGPSFEERQNEAVTTVTSLAERRAEVVPVVKSSAYRQTAVVVPMEASPAVENTAVVKQETLPWWVSLLPGYYEATKEIQLQSQQNSVSPEQAPLKDGQPPPLQNSSIPEQTPLRDNQLLLPQNSSTHEQTSPRDSQLRLPQNFSNPEQIPFKDNKPLHQQNSSTTEPAHLRCRDNHWPSQQSSSHQNRTFHSIPSVWMTEFSADPESNYAFQEGLEHQPNEFGSHSITDCMAYDQFRLPSNKARIYKSKYQPTNQHFKIQEPSISREDGCPDVHITCQERVEDTELRVMNKGSKLSKTIGDSASTESSYQGAPSVWMTELAASSEKVHKRPDERRYEYKTHSMNDHTTNEQCSLRPNEASGAHVGGRILEDLLKSGVNTTGDEMLKTRDTHSTLMHMNSLASFKVVGSKSHHQNNIYMSTASKQGSTLCLSHEKDSQLSINSQFPANTPPLPTQETQCGQRTSQSSQYLESFELSSTISTRETSESLNFVRNETVIGRSSLTQSFSSQTLKPFLCHSNQSSGQSQFRGETPFFTAAARLPFMRGHQTVQGVQPHALLRLNNDISTSCVVQQNQKQLDFIKRLPPPLYGTNNQVTYHPTVGTNSKTKQPPKRTFPQPNSISNNSLIQAQLSSSVSLTHQNQISQPLDLSCPSHHLTSSGKRDRPDRNRRLRFPGVDNEPTSYFTSPLISDLLLRPRRKRNEDQSSLQFQRDQNPFIRPSHLSSQTHAMSSGNKVLADKVTKPNLSLSSGSLPVSLTQTQRKQSTASASRPLSSAHNLVLQKNTFLAKNAESVQQSSTTTSWPPFVANEFWLNRSEVPSKNTQQPINQTKHARWPVFMAYDGGLQGNGRMANSTIQPTQTPTFSSLPFTVVNDLWFHGNVRTVDIANKSIQPDIITRLPVTEAHKTGLQETRRIPENAKQSIEQPTIVRLPASVAQNANQLSHPQTFSNSSISMPVTVAHSSGLQQIRKGDDDCKQSTHPQSFASLPVSVTHSLERQRRPAGKRTLEPSNSTTGDTGHMVIKRTKSSNNKLSGGLHLSSSVSDIAMTSGELSSKIHQFTFYKWFQVFFFLQILCNISFKITILILYEIWSTKKGFDVLLYFI